MQFSAFFLFVCVCALISGFYCYLIIIDVCSGQTEKLIKCYIIALAVIFQTESKKKEEMKRINFFPILPPVASSHVALSCKGHLDFSWNDGSKCFGLSLGSFLLVFAVTHHGAAPACWACYSNGCKATCEYQSSRVWQNGRRMTEKRRENHILSEACRNIKSNTWQEITPNPAALNMNHCNELCVEVYLKTVQKLSLVKTELLSCLWQHISPTIFTGTQGFFACSCVFWYLRIWFLKGCSILLFLFFWDFKFLRF